MSMRTRLEELFEVRTQKQKPVRAPVVAVVEVTPVATPWVPLEVARSAMGSLREAIARSAAEEEAERIRQQNEASEAWYREQNAKAKARLGQLYEVIDIIGHLVRIDLGSSVAEEIQDLWERVSSGTKDERKFDPDEFAKENFPGSGTWTPVSVIFNGRWWDDEWDGGETKDPHEAMSFDFQVGYVYTPTESEALFLERTEAHPFGVVSYKKELYVNNRYNDEPGTFRVGGIDMPDVALAMDGSRWQDSGYTDDEECEEHLRYAANSIGEQVELIKAKGSKFKFDQKKTLLATCAMATAQLAKANSVLSSSTATPTQDRRTT